MKLKGERLRQRDEAELFEKFETAATDFADQTAQRSLCVLKFSIEVSGLPTPASHATDHEFI